MSVNSVERITTSCVLSRTYVCYFCFAGEEDGNREAREAESGGQGEKTRHTAVGPEEWDGPSKRRSYVTLKQTHYLIRLCSHAVHYC